MTFNNAASVEHTHFTVCFHINKVAESTNIANNKGAYFCGIAKLMDLQ